MLCCTKKKMAPAVRQGFLSPYDSWDNRIAVLRFVQDIPLRKGDTAYDLVSDVEKSLSRFAGRPLMLLWGEKDFVFHCGFLKEWMARFPQAEVHRFPQSGHYVLEDSGDEIIPLIEKFLKAHPLER
jgi:haloalkane dehalogenase